VEFWSETGAGKLYVRINADQPQSKVSKGQCSEASKACTFKIAEAGTFWGAAASGWVAIYTEAGSLFDFNVSSRTVTPIAEGVLGVLGMSEDANTVYFVSKKALAGGAITGETNLYAWHEGSTTFVASLANSVTDAANYDLAPSRRTARVTPDGSHLLFMSTGRPTGYDNIDADPAKGLADAEVYLYDREAAKLQCISCNPSGARPQGRNLPGINKTVVPIASRIPGWENQIYPTRTMSSDGARVFFESYDALSLEDGNNQLDLYQWEAPGTGRCSAESREYFERVEGCVSLISSGDSPQVSEFVDASIGGGDVFFTTTSSLVAQDPGLVDIYDARVEGGLPAPAQPSPACEGDACQSPPSAPLDQTPASNSYVGPGNPVPPVQRHKHHRKKHRTKKVHGKHQTSKAHRRRGKGR